MKICFEIKPSLIKYGFRFRLFPFFSCTLEFCNRNTFFPASNNECIGDLKVFRSRRPFICYVSTFVPPFPQRKNITTNFLVPECPLGLKLSYEIYIIMAKFWPRSCWMPPNIIYEWSLVGNRCKKRPIPVMIRMIKVSSICILFWKMALLSLILGYVTDPTRLFKGQLILAAMFWASNLPKKILYELNLSSLNLNH